MSHPTRTIFRGFRRRLTATYLLSVAEYVLELLYPFAIGIAINGLLAGDGIMSVLPLAVFWISQAAVGAIYQLVSSRLVAKIYRSIAGDMVLRDRSETNTTSQVSARVDMVEKVCDALTDVVPMLLSGVVSIIGSAVMLFVYDVRAGGVAVALIVTISLIQWWFSLHAVRLNERINTRRESQVHIIAGPKPARVISYFHRITRLRVRFNDTETLTWSIADVFSLAAVLSVLFIVTGVGTYDAGSIYAIVTYVMTLTDSLENAPILVDEGAHFYDVASRVAGDMPAE